MDTSNLEKERKELTQINREIFLAEGDIERLRKKIDRIEERKNKLYLEIDKKLDGE